MPHMHHQHGNGSSRSGDDAHHGNIVSLCDHRARQQAEQPRILRLSPECDGIELLYANDRHPDTLFSLKVLAWARLDDGSVTALVPWLRNVVPAEKMADPLNGRWMGYRLPDSQYLFEDAPEHKVQELEAAVAFFSTSDAPVIPQQIPDTIGTHAVFSSDGFHTISLIEVVSWQLDSDGQVHALVADEERITRTPVLPNDPCLVDAQQQADFRYFFQHGIANRLKDQDPEALAAIANLTD